MTTKPKAKKFRIRRGPPTGGAEAAPVVGLSSAAKATAKTATKAAPDGAPAPEPSAAAKKAMSIDEIRQEGLTGRQLRMARRVAQKRGFAVTSDFDAVRQLRAAGVDPFQQSTILELVAPRDGTTAPGAAKAAPGAPEVRAQLPQTVPDPKETLPSTERADPAARRTSEIMNIQRDIARRRRRKLTMLFARLSVFVLLPTLLVGWYYATVATPMYATNSEFVIQQADSGGGGAGGLGGLFQGTSMATQQDSIAVQSFLASRSAMLRLDEEHGFKAHFSDPSIDVIQRLDVDATNEEAFRLYADKVKVSYDPTEGILRMEVIAAAPDVSQTYSEALIGYAEEQIDQLTQRLREDQMAGARASYQAAEERRADALAAWLEIQQDVQIIDSAGETAARTQQISALETERQRLQLVLQERLSVARPNQAQVDALRGQISNIEDLIADLRRQMTAETDGGTSLAARNTELRLAEENYTFQTLLVQQALTQMEAAQIEANRQVRFLELGVEPIAPDEATYPRAFENTVLAFLVLAGIYLMISITASILREQVSA